MKHAKKTISLPKRLLGVIALALSVLQALKLFLLIDLYAVDVPFWDQWGFYEPFFEPHGVNAQREAALAMIQNRCIQ